MNETTKYAASLHTCRFDFLSKTCGEMNFLELDIPQQLRNKWMTIAEI